MRDRHNCGREYNCTDDNTYRDRLLLSSPPC
jgi:hypothetical protein